MSPAPRYSRHNINTIPSDILLEVVSYLYSLSDRLNFSRTSSRIFPRVIPSIYATVDLQGIDECEPTLSMLARTPALARHVQKLIVHPDGVGKRKQHESIRAWNCAHTVSSLVAAASKHMDALHTFAWDGEDTLPDDLMWSELQKSCPNLKTIETTFGSYLPRPSSHLFAFEDLEGFSLTFKGGFYAHGLHVPSRGRSRLPDRPSLRYSRADMVSSPPSASSGRYRKSESSPVFTRLWDMLVTRCPNLQSLAIVGTSNEPGDGSRLSTACWPQLKSLTIGDIVFDSPVHHAPTTQAFADFLERHPMLEVLNLHGHPNVVPVELGSLSEKALPNLKSFSGALHHLRALAARGVVLQHQATQAQQFTVIYPSTLANTLQSVAFPEPMQLRDLTPLSISAVLQGMHSLTSLEISFSLQSGYDSNGVLRTIVSSCPNLTNLDLTCACKPSFYMESFSRTLRNLRKLTTLSVSIVKVPGDESMHTGAARIALSNPRLHKFDIAFLPANVPVTRGVARPPALEHGSYELLTDAYGIPVSLLAHERIEVPWASKLSIGAVVGSVCGRKVRRCTYELRPHGHPDVAQKNWGQLFMDRGPAGQEARLIAFCVWLLILAAWGVGKAVGNKLLGAGALSVLA
ncbi:hypothetical protein EUX98_g1695 [Antrodiella citrinella]|uniref:F-box domain-containing protein n=1 Tax=Antrodiella citrinella TaxID=2447956 RepID=A0A4S4N0U3_9APHY|nr:hypothetical protein EUX98_g1695 [Antrodiella citrinella]